MTEECKFDPEVVRQAAQPKKNRMKTTWRWAMAYIYMLVIVFDFIIFPSFFMYYQSVTPELAAQGFNQWSPITLGGGGFFHIAMGAIIGVYAYQRSREKIEGVADDYTGISREITERDTESFTPTGS